MTSTNYLGLKRSGHAFYRMTNQGLDPAVVGDGMKAIEDEGDWYPTWTRVAERYEDAARTAQAASRTVSAAQLWTRASLAFHFAQYLHFSDLAQKEAAALRKVECFNAALPLHAVPGVRLEAAFEGRSLPVVFRTPHPRRKLPLALLVCGSDSSKEEHFRIENEYLARGMATVSFDGPGQGEFARFMAMRPDYHRVVSAVIDRVGLLEQVDPDRIGVVGFGFGGLLAVSAACHDPRVRACVSVSGYFDMSVMDWDDTIRANRFRHLVGTDSIAHARQQAEQFSLASCIARLDRPLLVMHGARDAGIPEEAARRIATEARGPTDYVCVEGGVHCFHNVAWRAQPLMTDWLHEKLTVTA